MTEPASDTTRTKLPSLSHQTVLDLLKSRAGLIFPDIRLGEITRAIDKAASKANFSTAQYAFNLSIDDASFDELCNEVTIPESYFFRDPKHFEFVKNRVIPEWRKSSFQNGQLLAWSAGCSTGEEAYSLSILFEQEGLTNLFKITATDICRKSLKAAGNAEYSPWSLRTADQRFLSANFDQTSNQFSLKERFKSGVNFAHLNLMADQSKFKKLHLEELDLIFCRNVLIYFDPTAIARAMRNFYEMLKPGGYLILGPSDPPASQYADFDVVVCDFGVFYQKVDKIAAAAAKAAKQDFDGEITAEKRLSDSKDKLHALQEKQGRATHQTAKGHKPSDKSHDKAYDFHPHVYHPQVSASVVKKLSDEDVLSQGQAAYNQGLYEKAYLLTDHALDNENIAVLHVKALANFKGSLQAEKSLQKLISRHPGSFHLQYLHGHLLLDLGQLDASLAALKRSLFLEPRTIMAHFTMGHVQKQLGDRVGAKRSFRNVVDLCKNKASDEVLPFGDGERVKILVAAANSELEALAV